MKFDKAQEAVSARAKPERIIAVCKTSLRRVSKGSETSLSGALALTPTRVLFSGSFLMERADLSIPVDTITSVDQHRQALLTFTTITAAGAAHRFLEMPPSWLDKLNQVRTGTVPVAKPGDIDLDKLSASRGSPLISVPPLAVYADHCVMNGLVWPLHGCAADVTQEAAGRKQHPVVVITGQTFSGVPGRWTFRLGPKQDAQAKQVADVINTAAAALRGQEMDFERVPGAEDEPVAPGPQLAAPSGGAEEIIKLADLHKQGILTDEEFAAAKARLLGL